MRLKLAILAILLLMSIPARAGMQGMGAPTTGSGSNIVVAAPVVNASASCELVAPITTTNGVTVTATGWTSQQVCTAGSRATTWLTKAASGTEGGNYTFNFSITQTAQDARIYAFCGVNTANPVDQMGCNTSLTSPSLTPTLKDEDMLIGWHQGATITTWPTSLPQSGVDTGGGDASYSALITNTSAQSYTMTTSGSTNPYSGAMIFNMISNNRAWGMRSFATQARVASITSYPMTAPINIEGSEDRIDIILILESSSPTPSVSGGTSSWTCTGLSNPSGEKIWDCVGTGLKSTDTTYTATWTGSTNATGYLIDTIWVTGTDQTAGQVNGSAGTCPSPTLTTSAANEPVISWCGIEGPEVMGTFPASTSPFYPPGPTTTGANWQTGIGQAFEMKATAGVTSTRTWGCSANCGSAIGGSLQIAQSVATPAPTPAPGGAGSPILNGPSNFQGPMLTNGGLADAR